MSTYAEGRPDALLTIEQFANLHDTSADRLELVRGRVVREPPAGGEHGLIGINLAYLIRKYLEDHPIGLCFGADTGFILARDPDIVRAPDVAFVRNDRLPEVPQSYIPVAPDLVVEIVSPSDRTGELLQKIGEFLEAGTQIVWVVYPRTQTVAEYAVDAAMRIYGAEETLTAPELMPDFQLPAARIFD